MSERRVEIQLLMDFAGKKPLYEAVPAIDLGGGRFRLTASPGFAPGVASGDEIEMAPSEKVGYRVLKRAGNVCVQLFLTACDAGERARIEGMVHAIGGWLDGGADGSDAHLLIFTIPVTVGFEVIERTMDQISTAFRVGSWMYGNVYDTRDGVTPLNWWR